MLTIRNVAWVALVGLTVGAWGLFRRTSWWETVSVVSAVVGVLVLLRVSCFEHRVSRRVIAGR